jgi:hypothetical protein
LEAPFANGAQERVPTHDGIAIGQAFVSHGRLYPYSKSGDTGTPIDHALYYIVVAYHTPTHTKSRNIPAVFPIPRLKPTCHVFQPTRDGSLRDLYTSQAFRYSGLLWLTTCIQLNFKNSTIALPMNKVLVRWQPSGHVGGAPRF